MPVPKDVKPLLDRIAKDDPRAFRTIFHSFSRMVYSFSFRLTRSEYSAEEIVQEVFLKIWTHRASLPAIENFPAYVFTITRNLTFNVLKRRATEERAKQTLSRQPGNHQNTEEVIIYRDYQQLLNRAINHLPPQQKLVYSLCHQEGLRYEEVARKLRISSLTVKTHMQQAMRTIRSQFVGIMRASIVVATVSSLPW